MKNKTDKAARLPCGESPVHRPVTITSRYARVLRPINGRPCRYQSEATERRGRERKGQGAIKMYEVRCRKRERVEMKVDRASSRSRQERTFPGWDRRTDRSLTGVPIRIGRCGDASFCSRRWKFHFLKVSFPDSLCLSRKTFKILREILEEPKILSFSSEKKASSMKIKGSTFWDILKKISVREIFQNFIQGDFIEVQRYMYIGRERGRIIWNLQKYFFKLFI